MTPPQRPAAVKPGVPPPPPALPFPRRERLAPVLSHRPGAIVFAVDDVTPATLRKICLFAHSDFEWRVGELCLVAENPPPQGRLPFTALLFARRRDGRALCVNFASELKPRVKASYPGFGASWAVCTVQIASEEEAPPHPDLLDLSLTTVSAWEFNVIDLDIIAALTFLLDHGGRLPDEVDVTDAMMTDLPEI